MCVASNVSAAIPPLFTLLHLDEHSAAYVNPDFYGPSVVAFTTPEIVQDPYNDYLVEDFLYGRFQVDGLSCVVYSGAYALQSVVTEDTPVESLDFAEDSLSDSTSKWCAVRDSTGSVWAINRLPGIFTEGNYAGRVVPCLSTDVFNPMTGCLAAPTNTPPTADAGADQSIRAGDTVLLNGSNSYDDNTATTALEFSWILLPPTSSSAALSGATTATPSFVADIAGSYDVQLVVTDDGALVSTLDVVTISSTNLAPTAVAGNDQLVIIGTPTALDGLASSDPESDTLSYAWTLNTPIGSTTMLIAAETATPELTPDLPGTYEVTLTVSDLLGAGETDQVDVIATTASGYADIQIINTDAIVVGLTETQVTNGGNQQVLGNLFSKAIMSLNKANAETDPDKVAMETAKALQKLNDAIERTDGCAVWGSPDDKDNSKERGKPQIDWITDCDAQSDVYPILQDAVNALTP